LTRIKPGSVPNTIIGVRQGFRLRGNGAATGFTG
jgi:hypothetical protein